MPATPRINGIATVSLSGTLEDKIRAAAAAGFDGVEIFDTDFLGSALSAEEVRALLDELGLICLLYQPFRDFEGMPEPYRSRAFDRMRQKFAVMKVLGCDRILLCSNCSPLSSGDRDRIIADFRELGDLAAEHGMMIGYEALAWGLHVNDHRQAWDIVKAVDHPNIGILLDSFHSLSRGIPNASIRDLDPAKITFVQLADAPVMDMDYLYWSRHFRNLPGQGGLDLTGYVSELLRIGYSGPLSLEIFNDRFRSNSATMVAHDGIRSLNALRDSAARAIGARTWMPARATIDRVEFVEIAVEDQDRSTLADMLGQAGFVLVGSHRNKKVERWRNGGVNLILNHEEAGFAAAYRHMHGTAVCAIGLVVIDGPSTMARARALDIHPHPTDMPAMPALRGVAGSLVYVLDVQAVEGIWRDEFEGTDATPPDMGLVGIDHLGAVVNSDEFLSWQLYWRSLFDLHVQMPQDVIDPNGLVQSQAIQNRSGSFRITINSTDAREALSARFLSSSFGGGYQHVALLARNLNTVAATLADKGLPRMPVPANYQDDVAARFGLSDEASATLRANDMLIDEDGDGRRYRQIYSRAFAKTFFFEFVERAGYEGYGSPNAAIRLAAQSRFRDPLPID